ncbi:type I polyketide synthase [Streptomyces sp. NPDC002851]
MPDDRTLRYLKRVTAELQYTREQLSKAERRGQDPIAVVGMGCRYPGAVASAADLWDVVATCRDVVSDLPRDRGWDLEALYDADPDRPGTAYARAGGFLDGVAEFDADFFGIGRTEATAMDPQQRLLLQTVWETLEDAGVDPAALRSSATGVYVGTSGQDYEVLARSGGGDLEGYWGTGTAGSVLAGRVAYAFGFEGPTLTIDTACSASLTAVHLAAQGLRQGECSLALAGGVTVMSTTGVLTEFSRQRGLSPDGRCRAYAQAAEGTGWAEGVGVVLLERLSDARRNNHRVYALIPGTAINQDGASNGLTAPNGLAQQRVITQALHNARLRARDVDAVEGHGTGTTLGDPIEIDALQAVYGQDRPAGRPLRLGSLKSNIGHSQAAAGIGGLIKMVQALRHQVLPRTLHVDRPTDKADWSSGGIELLTEPVPWPRTEGRTRRAAVSAFGISGSNAHVIVEEAPAEDATEAPAQAPEEASRPGPAPEPTGLPVPWVLSAKSPAALDAQAARLHAWLEDRPHATPTEVGAALALTRSRFEHRAVVMGRTRPELLDGLASLGRGELPLGVVRGTAPRRAKAAFLFTGQGAQRPGAGRELAAAHPEFDRLLDEVCAELDRHLDRPLRPVLFAADGTEEAELLHRTDFTQPALFALEVALYRLVDSWGFRPDFLIGHSVGELAAVHAAGALSLADASALVAARGRLMQALPAAGAMAVVEATEEEVRESLRHGGAELAVAAVNGPESTVVSGPREELLDWQRQWRERGRRTRRLRVSHAFHSPLVRPMVDELAALAAKLEFRAPAVPVISNVTGATADAATLANPDYWAAQAEQPVRFHDSVRHVERAGATAYLELGPDGVLTGMAEHCLEDPAKAVLATALHRRGPEPETLLTALAELHAHGAGGDLAGLFEPSAARRVPLPTYPFQGRRYWVEGPGVRQTPQARPQPEPQSEPEPEPQSEPQASGRLGPADALTLVRTQTSLVLGEAADADLDEQATLRELGVTSLAAVRLQRRLSVATGLELPATLLVDHPTPAALAEHLRHLLADRSSDCRATPGTHARGVAEPPTWLRHEDAPAPCDRTHQTPRGRPSSDGGSVTTGPGQSAAEGTYTRFLRDAHARGELPAAVPQLSEAARRLPSFTSAPTRPDEQPEAVLVSDGSAGSAGSDASDGSGGSGGSGGSEAPVVVCVPSFLAGSGPHQYARFAAGFARRSRMWALNLPGFGPAQPLPATWRAAVDSLAAVAVRVADGAPVLLVGHSIGGALAHAVAACLERAGHRVAGVVLIDTYEPETGPAAQVFGWAMGSILARESAGVDLHDGNVLAMGGYLGLLDGWRPDPVRAPTLLLTAKDRPDAPGSAAWPLWRTAHRVTTIPGDHFSILEEHATDTARAIEDWLGPGHGPGLGLGKETPCSPSA